MAEVDNDTGYTIVKNIYEHAEDAAEYVDSGNDELRKALGRKITWKRIEAAVILLMTLLRVEN